MPIVDLLPDDLPRIEQISEILRVSFADFAPAWLPTLEAARETVLESFGPDRISRVSLDDEGEVAGWIGGEHAYGRLWELHPLVVAPSQRRRGVARELVADLARLVAARGALTLQVSTSDETDRTSMFGVDLYRDPLEALRQLRSTREHPLDFYRRVGFTLVGVEPDAEGPGMPSILLAMRVGGS
jgi:aminoglycoside 6'-N-acetyltransferase I